MDIIEFGTKLKEDKFDLDDPVVGNLSSMLECFGEIRFDEEMIWIEQKEDKDRGRAIPKEIAEKK